MFHDREKDVEEGASMGEDVQCIVHVDGEVEGGIHREEEVKEHADMRADVHVDGEVEDGVYWGDG